MARRKWLSLSAIWGLAAIAIMPVLLHWTAPAPRRNESILAVGLAGLTGALYCFGLFKAECKRLTRSQSFGLVALIAIQACIATFVHHHLVDDTSGWGSPTNASWQLMMQNLVVRLAPEVLPHSYRFLPNSIVLWLQMMHVRFDVASEIYRMLCTLLLFYALYCYARLYTSYRGAVLAMLFAGLVYPTSFVAYAGQLTDPLSHLSFVLAFIFLETEDYPFFLSTLIIGSVAKETVLALSGFYLLFYRRQTNYLAKATILCAATLGTYFSVRVFVLHGSMQYHEISNVTLSHVSENLYDYKWVLQTLVTLGSYIPFVILAWKDTPISLKRLIFFLFPVLFLSSLFFSWLIETRNYMPVVFSMAIIAGRYFDAQPLRLEPHHTAHPMH
jgi:hypothetical protein